MPMEYSDEVVVGAVERVKAGETVKAVSRDLRNDPGARQVFLLRGSRVIG